MHVRRRLCASIGTLAVASLVLAACGDDGPPTVVNDASWSAPREQRTADFVMTQWSLDTFVATDMTFLPDGRALLLTKGGWDGPGVGQVFLLNSDGSTAAHLLDLGVCTDAERGLLGIAVDPDFGSNRRIFLYYTKGTSDCAIYSDPDEGIERVENRLSSFVFDETGIDRASEVVFLDHLDAGPSAHNGGGLSFMPDGTLLVGVGEAGTRSSRDLDTPYGKILRLDVSDPGAGATDNPYFDPSDPTAIRSLIYVSGMRNPFRVSADRASGRVAVADVGTDVYEEINILTPGADYGYPDAEGPETSSGATEPSLWYTHEGTCNSIIGGAWLRPEWAGLAENSTFAFTDFGCGGVFVAEVVGTEIHRVHEIAPALGYSLASVVVGPDEALYLVPIGPGAFAIQRLAPAPP